MSIDFDKEVEDFEGSCPKNVLEKLSFEMRDKYEEAIKVLDSISAKEEEIKQLKEKYKVLTEEEMPAILDNIGIKAIELPSGERVEVVSEIHCGIPASRKPEAFSWLKENGHEDLIKNEIKIKFGRKEGNSVSEIQKVAEQLGLNCEQKQEVHAMTLKAFVKEQTRSGKSLPSDLFGIFTRRVVNVNLKGK